MFKKKIIRSKEKSTEQSNIGPPIWQWMLANLLTDEEMMEQKCGSMKYAGNAMG